MAVTVAAASEYSVRPPIHIAWSASTVFGMTASRTGPSSLPASIVQAEG